MTMDTTAERQTTAVAYMAAYTKSETEAGNHTAAVTNSPQIHTADTAMPVTAGQSVGQNAQKAPHMQEAHKNGAARLAPP